MILQPAGYVSLVRNTYTELAANHISTPQECALMRKEYL